ncbi:MAG TPA: diguanylate cyclase [Pirellula sp.]|nr:diguanylate cyclase [Pirellula sp.]
MQLLSIENLGLAAEATVILLLLAISWHPRRKEPQNSLEGISWEPAKYFYLQAFIHRGLYLQQWRETQSLNSSPSRDSQPFIPLVVDDDDGNKPIMPAPWQDRLTRLLNRQGFDTILKEWLSIGQKHRGDSCLSMLTLSNYTEMVNAQGAMITEQALQRIATHLVAASSVESLVARYLPDRFVILHFASTIASCRKAMEFVQQGISEKEFFNVGGQPHALDSIVSILDLHGDSDIASRMDELEEGKIEAERSGRTMYSIAEGTWTDEGALNTYDANTLPEPRAESDTQAAVEDDSENEVSGPIASNDISAVANPDDITGLFSQINANKSSKSTETPNPNNLSPDANDPVEVTSSAVTSVNAVAIDVSGAASADDISALFASVKPDTAAAAPTVDNPKEQGNLSEAATSDDIASLFAIVKSAVNPTGLDNELNKSSPDVLGSETVSANVP